MFLVGVRSLRFTIPLYTLVVLYPFSLSTRTMKRHKSADNFAYYQRNGREFVL